jgi:hypothetical protein
MKAKIFRILQGVTEAISGLLPAGRGGKKTVQRKIASSGRRPQARIRTKGTQKHRRVGSLTVRRRHLRRTPKPIEPIKDNHHLSSPSRIAIYACPACGLQAPKTLMVEHLLSSPTHQRGRVEPEQADDHRVKEDLPHFLHEDQSRDSLRNLLQILLPPRAFGRRHEQKSANLSPK